MTKRLLAELKEKMGDSSKGLSDLLTEPPASSLTPGKESKSQRDSELGKGNTHGTENLGENVGMQREEMGAKKKSDENAGGPKNGDISQDTRNGGESPPTQQADPAQEKSTPQENVGEKNTEKQEDEASIEQDKGKAKEHHVKKSKTFKHRLPRLTAAVVDGDLEKVRELLAESYKISKNKKKKRSKTVSDARRRKDVDKKKPPAKDKRRYTAGSKKKPNSTKVVKERLLENDFMGATALHHACGLPKSVDDRDAIIDCLGEALQRTNCLHPIFSGLPGKVAKKLGATGETPLHIAAKQGFRHAVEMILMTVFGCRSLSVRGSEGDESGVGEHKKENLPFAEFPNLKDAKGRTPLHLAADKGHFDCLVALLAKDAALDYRDDKGLSPLDMALAKDHTECIMFLEKEGAGIDLKYSEQEEEDKNKKMTKTERKLKEMHKHVRELEAADSEKEDWEFDDYGWKIRTPSADEEEDGASAPQAKTDSTTASKKREKADKRHAKQWRKFLKKEEKYFPREKHAGLLHRMRSRGEMKKNKNRKKVVKLARKGIPLDMKGQIWAKLLEVEEWRDIHDTSYEPNSWGSKFVKQIDLDIARTHRENIQFKQRFSHKACQLFRILRAYSVYDKDLGYTQGMSDVVGLLLFYNEDEEEVFWMLDILMNRFELKELFRPGFPRLMENFYIHDQLVQHFLPRIHDHLQEHGVHVSTYTTKWYLMIFLNLPFEIVLRVWDSVLAEGYQLSFCIALALLDMHQDTILSLDFEATVIFLQHLDRIQIDGDKLIDLAIRYQRKLKPNSFKMLTDLRTAYQASIG